MIILIVLQEIAKIIFYLSLPAVLFTLYYRERQDKKEQKTFVESIADELLEKADDEKPIMLRVDQEKLIEKTADEIEKRQRLGG